MGRRRSPSGRRSRAWPAGRRIEGIPAIGRVGRRLGAGGGRPLNAYGRSSAAVTASSAARIARRVLGGRPAAATDDRRPGGEQAGHEAAEVVGRRGVDEPALLPLRQAGVGHDRARRLPAPAGPAARAHRGTRRARRRSSRRSHVDARSRVSAAAAGARVGPVGEHEVLAEGQRREDRQVGRRRAFPRPRAAGARGRRRSRGSRRPCRPRAAPRSARGRHVADLASSRGGGARGPAAQRADGAADQRVAPGDLAASRATWAARRFSRDASRSPRPYASRR